MQYCIQIDVSLNSLPVTMCGKSHYRQSSVTTSNHTNNIQKTLDPLRRLAAINMFVLGQKISRWAMASISSYF